MLRPIIIFILILVLNCFGVGQSTDSIQTAPKLGLVLSGGGAKGFAHIGLLKVMEEVGLRPDYITGASMGSIIGGLYSLGIPAEDLEAFAINQDWPLLLSNKIDLRKINIIEKEDYGDHIISFDIRDGGLRLRQGIIEGQELSMVLARLACSAHLIDSFDDFPIPFKCVAVNILNGEVVTLDSGYLARAQRASMSIPTLFTPVEYKDKLLIDGGVIRNLPVSEILDMGADITLASYTGGKYIPKEDLQSAIDVLIQTNFLYSIADSDEQIELADHYIELDGQFTQGDFDKAAEIIAEGELQARQYIDELKMLAEYMNSFKRDPPKPALNYPDSLVIKHLNTSSVAPYLVSLVRSSLNLKEGKAYPIMEIEDGINYVYGTSFFKKVNFSLSSDSLGTTINIETKEVTPAILRLGLHYSNADDAAIITKIEYRGLFNQPTILKGQARISSSPALNGQYVHYFGPMKRCAYRIGSAYRKNNQFFAWQEQAINRRYSRHKLKTFGELLWIPKNNFLMGTGYRWNRWVMSPKQNEDLDITKLTSMGQSVDLFFNWNSFNHALYPRSGHSFKILGSYNHSLSYDLDFTNDESMDYLNPALPNNYFKLQLFGSNYNSIGSRITFFQHLAIGITSEPIVFDNFVLGGDYFTGQDAIPFVGLKEYAAPFSKVASVQMGLRYMINARFLIDFKGSLARNLEDVKDVNGAETSFYGLGMSVIYESFFGPMSFTLGKSNWANELQLAINLGYRFNY